MLTRAPRKQHRGTSWWWNSINTPPQIPMAHHKSHQPTTGSSPQAQRCTEPKGRWKTISGSRGRGTLSGLSQESLSPSVSAWHQPWCWSGFWTEGDCCLGSWDTLWDPGASPPKERPQGSPNQLLGGARIPRSQQLGRLGSMGSYWADWGCEPSCWEDPFCTISLFILTDEIHLVPSLSIFSHYQTSIVVSQSGEQDKTFGVLSVWVL